ncbi:Putative motility protein [Lachnospiraceae bacterium]|nr:Putative motility protein [Lachnospiraceae bacterium]
MEIASLSMGMAQSKSLQDIGTAVLAKSLDTVEAAGDSMVKMMEQSVNPGLGANIDIKV